MSFLVKSIRDHYLIYCNCDGKVDSKIWEEEISDISKNYSLSYLFSCAVVSSGIMNKKRIKCDACGKKYIIGKRDEELAYESYELFIESLKKRQV